MSTPFYILQILEVEELILKAYQKIGGIVLGS